MRLAINICAPVGALGAVACLLLCACGGDSGTSFSGVYAIDAWTKNDDNCNAEGDSIFADQTETHFYIKNANIFGNRLVNADLCTSLATCTTEQQDSSLLGVFNLDQGSDSAGHKGVQISAGAMLGSDLCQGTLRSIHVSESAGTVIRFQIEERKAENVPKDSDGFCTTDAIQDAAMETPCLSLEVFSGTLVP